MMLAWIPFRAETVSDSFLMWSKVINPNAYFELGMKENTYLVAAVIMISIFIAWIVKSKLNPFFDKSNRVILISSEIIFFSVLLPLVIIFLRPINQFIYFQF